jgi:hypothetical protein
MLRFGLEIPQTPAMHYTREKKGTEVEPPTIR